MTHVPKARRLVLPARERHILALLAHGFTQQEISDLTGIKFFYVKKIIGGIFRYIKAKNVADAVRLAYVHGFVQPCDAHCLECRDREEGNP